jgi:hypothetical protein
MKKTFVNPEMNISLFNMENVLTDSAVAPSNKEAATTALNTLGEKNITEIQIAF